MAVSSGRPALSPKQAAARDQRVLVDAFCNFHADVVTQKRLVVASGGVLPYDAVQQRLLDAFEQQASKIQGSLPEHERRLFEETRYVMIAMADEVFLHLVWSGREPWADKPLEAVVFQTRDSGDRFFNRIDDALIGRIPASSQLLTVYLTALALGFRGRYAPLGTGEPETYRARIVDFLARTDPEIVRGEELCPQAHEHTAQGAPQQRLPSLSRGLLPFLVVIIGWIVIGEILWLYRTAELDGVLDRIEDAT
jgi:type VI secretion system protein ImpK